MASSKRALTVEVRGDATSLIDAASKGVKSLQTAADRISKLDFGKGFENLGRDVTAATQSAQEKLRHLNDLKLAQKTLAIDADISKAETSLKKLAASADHTESKFERLKGGIGSAFSNVTNQLGPAGTAVDSIANSLGGVGTAGLAAGAGIAAAGFLVQKSVGSYLSLAKATREFQAITRASTEDSSRFVNVLGDLGIRSEAGAKALGAMSRNLDTKKWQELGIEIKKNVDGSTDMVGTFRNVLASLEKIPDAQQRANVLAATFGKSYQEILPLIERGAAGFDKLLKGNEGQVLKADDLKRAEQLRKTFDELGDLAADFAIQIGRYAVPVINLLANGVRDTAATFGHLFDLAIDGFQKLIDVADVALGPLVNFDDRLVRNKMEKLGQALASVGAEGRKTADSTGIAGTSLEDLAAKAAAAAEKLEAAAKKDKDLRDAFDKRITASFSLSSATDKAAKAFDGLNVAQEIANERAKAGAQVAEEVGRRKDTVEKAIAGLAEQRVRNSKDIEAAEKAILTAQDKVSAAGETFAKAHKDMANATDEARVAAGRATSADEAYRRVLQGVGTDADAAKDALLGLNEAKDGKTSAEIGVRGAERRVATAQKALAIAGDQTKVDRKRTQILLDLEDAAHLVEKAEKAKADVMARGTYTAADLADAERGIARARVEQEARTADLNEQLANLAATTGDVSQAQDDLTQAELGLVGARRDLDKATERVSESAGKYKNVTSGYAADSKEAKEADEKRSKAVDDVNKANEKSVTAAANLMKVTKDQGAAIDGVKDANRALAEKITDAKRAEDDRKKTLEDAETALHKVGLKTTVAKDETVKYKDAIREAISAQVDQITKSNEASGKIQSDASVMAEAIGKVTAKVQELADPKLWAALQAVSTPVLNSMKVGAGIVGPVSGSSSDAYKNGTGTNSILAIATASIGQGEKGPNAINGAGQLLDGRALAGEVNAWCQAYVNAVLKKADIALPPGISDGTRASLTAFRRAGAGIGVNETDAGDLVYKTRGTDQTKGHVGIVVSRQGNKITTLEGNSTGDKVQRRTRNASEWNLGGVDTDRLQSNTKTTAETVKKAFEQDYRALTTAQKNAATLLALKDLGMSDQEAQQRLNEQLRLNGGDINKAVASLGLTKDQVGEFAAEVGGNISKFAEDVAGDINNMAGGFLAGTLLFSDAVNRFSTSGGGGGGPRVVGPDVFEIPPSVWDAVGKTVPGGDIIDYWKTLGGYASGGFVSARPGGTMGIIGEGGQDEIVSPVPMLRAIVREESGGGGGDIHLNFYGPTGSAEQFAADLEPKLREMWRRNGRIDSSGSLMLR